MAVTKTVKGKYIYFESDLSSTTAAAVKELTESLNGDNIKPENVILFDSSNQIVVARHT